MPCAHAARSVRGAKRTRVAAGACQDVDPGRGVTRQPVLRGPELPRRADGPPATLRCVGVSPMGILLSPLPRPRRMGTL
jgi:hypothetical protein